MPFSDPFDNAPPASVTPSRGAAFDNSWWPQLRYQSKAFFESFVRPTWSPANATASTVNGWVMPGGSSTAFCDGSASGSFSGIANNNLAVLFSVAITPQTVYPLLLATCGGFSFYAATAGVSYSAEGFRVTVAGTAFITGPNGYTSTGHFRYTVWGDPEDETNAFQQPYDFVELQVYAQEAGLAAQPSNTATTRRDLRPAVGSAFENERAQLKYNSSAVFSVPLAACSVVPSNALTTIFLPNLQGSINGSPGRVTGLNFTAAASGGMTRTGIFNDFPTALAISFNTNVEGDSPRFQVCSLAGAPIYLEGKGRWAKTVSTGMFQEQATLVFSGPCFFHHPSLGVLQGIGEVESTYDGGFISYTLTGVTMRFFINNTGLASSFTNTAP